MSNSSRLSPYVTSFGNLFALSLGSAKCPSYVLLNSARFYELGIPRAVLQQLSLSCLYPQLDSL